MLLVATPALRDPNFAATVVLLIDVADDVSHAPRSASNGDPNTGRPRYCENKYDMSVTRPTSHVPIFPWRRSIPALSLKYAATAARSEWFVWLIRA